MDQGFYNIGSSSHYTWVGVELTTGYTHSSYFTLFPPRNSLFTLEFLSYGFNMVFRIMVGLSNLCETSIIQLASVFLNINSLSSILLSHF